VNIVPPLLILRPEKPRPYLAPPSDSSSAESRGLPILHASRGGPQRCLISGSRAGVKNSACTSVRCGTLGPVGWLSMHEIIFHSASVPGNAALRALASLSSGRNRETHELPQKCAHRWRDTARTGPPRYPLGLLCSCRPVRDLRASPSIRAGTFHSSTTALVSSQSARSPVDDGCSRSVDCL
jgi:hypothetical protein